MFKHILMPICVNGNHWVLMVVNIKEKTLRILDSMDGQSAGRWFNLWTQFMQGRDSLPDITEQFGAWVYCPTICNQQTDGSSCGVFALMNAECVVLGLPVEIMRQVHVRGYRHYVKTRLLQAGTKKLETTCDMPECKVQRGHHRWVQCCVCGKWFHTRCCGIPTKSAIEDEYECCFCSAMYR